MEEEDIYDSKDDPDEPAPQPQNRSIWEGFLGDLAGREVILDLEADGITLECGRCYFKKVNVELCGALRITILAPSLNLSQIEE